MRVNRTLTALLAGSLAMTGLAACGGKSAATTKSSGVLNIGMPDGATLPANNNPYLDASFAKHLGYTWLIWEPLALQNEAKPTADPKPWLATKWDWSNGYSTLTLTIRDNVKWSDGSAMTADDVAYSFQIMKDNKGVNYYALPIKDVSSSGSTVTVNFDGSQYVNRTKILSTQVVNKKQWSAMADPSKDTVANPIGTGPYKIKSVTPSTVTLDVRSDYWQKPPKVGEIRCTTYSGNDTQLPALTSGATDWSYEFLANAKSTFVARDPAHFKLWFPPALSADGLWFNTTKKPFDNPHLRRAMSMVVNRDDIFNEGEAGYFKPKIDNITGIPTPAGDPFIAAQYKGKSSQADVATAKKELTDNGFTYAGNTLKDPTGKAVTLTLSDPADWNDYQTDLTIIKDNLATIGITASIDKANQDAWFDAVGKGNFDAVMHWTNGGATPYDMYQNIMDSAQLQPIGTTASGNYGRFNSPDATAALKAYTAATDDAGRQAALEKIEQIMVEQMPMIPTSAGNLGAEYSTAKWTGWPDESNPYEANQPTRPGMLDVVLHLTPAS
ncbi:ABC transporter substrate-binding protein [Rugosimonospora africana]|uniref:Peptide ABC transporter substrate-binding protein n=1 Tax=Rugosimonospora africana TaxID=556532 RepID=A0A8J3QVQ4_9ACTN|nr:ABC transporter substrate-binding protein [Rugosimonospora africana]GIH16673.1 peptide ABC transporter substrate-binding protein [Rugosimonospora africana]